MRFKSQYQCSIMGLEEFKSATNYLVTRYKSCLKREKSFLGTENWWEWYVYAKANKMGLKGGYESMDGDSLWEWLRLPSSVNIFGNSQLHVNLLNPMNS